MTRPNFLRCDSGVVRVFMRGGLGNQMFQFAAGFTIAKRFNRKLVLDTSFFELPAHSRSSRNYELNKFSLPAEIAEVSNGQLYFRFWRKVSSLLPKRILRMIGIVYQSNPFESVGNNSYAKLLIGYFQHKNAFTGFEFDLRRIFSNVNLSSKALFIRSTIRGCERSICLHVRRGDYITSSNSHNSHGIQAVDYYLNSIEEIKSNLKSDSLDIFVFSDDIAWCKQHFVALERVQFVETDDMSSPEIMLIMSACKHFVIANSTFSWWAAWLGKSPDSIVIMPEKWTTVLDTEQSGLLI